MFSKVFIALGLQVSHHTEENPQEEGCLCQTLTETDQEFVVLAISRFLAISALSADLALREPDYRRKSLEPTRPTRSFAGKVARSTSKEVAETPSFPQTSKVGRDRRKGRPRWLRSSPHFLIAAWNTRSGTSCHGISFHSICPIFSQLLCKLCIWGCVEIIF